MTGTVMMDARSSGNSNSFEALVYFSRLFICHSAQYEYRNCILY